ncbi:MAG: dihydropteroate synthase, partial [Candidatus Caenarcaniphilales bacterium]|nr:dihydropteroate synthase [Candidatus Caenarcaniphilales bacterium]
MFSKPNKQFFRIINLSADSFSGDAFADVDKALAAARAFPCDVLDIGAVSTRPGASSIESSQEIQILGKFFDKYDLDQDLSLD